jgi:putative FmdB family regulatory protein
MPTYEYVCTECGEKINIRATIAEKEKGLKVTCLKCGGMKMAQVFGNFMVMGSSKTGNKSSCCGSSTGSDCC